MQGIGEVTGTGESHLSKRAGNTGAAGMGDVAEAGLATDGGAGARQAWLEHPLGKG